LDNFQLKVAEINHTKQQSLVILSNKWLITVHDLV